MYAHFKKLLYFSTECLYAPFAARGFARTYIKVWAGHFQMIFPLHRVVSTSSYDRLLMVA